MLGKRLMSLSTDRTFARIAKVCINTFLKIFLSRDLIAFCKLYRNKMGGNLVKNYGEKPRGFLKLAQSISRGIA